MRNKKIALIGTTGLPAKYGGFETLAHHLTLNLNSQFDFSVYCSSKYFGPKGERKTTFNGSKLIYLPLNANGYQSIIYDFISIIHALIYADVLLILGISGSVILPIVKLFSSKPIIVNIDGQEWKRGKWNKLTQRFLKFSESIAVKYADTIITDNKAISDYVLEHYGKTSALITYGGDHVSKPALNEAFNDKYSFIGNNKYAFTVCRIEPENNIKMILEAYAGMPYKMLIIVGLWNHGKFGMQLFEQYSKYPNIHLLDPIYDQHELNMLRAHASVYIHGHAAGGTNPSLVEAMCLGLPIIAYGVTYNRETTMHKAIYFNDARELQKAVNSCTEGRLFELGETMSSIGNANYKWLDITMAYSDEINKLCNNKDFTHSSEKEVVNESKEMLATE